MAKTLTPADHPNIGFKLGTQSAMNTLLGQGTSANAAHGTFYLTSDTHRLYIGNSDGSISPVNQGVITVANVAALTGVTAEAGEFYYASSENVLCTYSGGQWVQINTVNTISSFTASGAASNGVTTITHTIGESTGGSTPASFSITGAGGAKVTSSGTAITVTGDVASLAAASDTTDANGKTAKVTLSHTDSSQTASVVKIVAGNDMSMSVANGTITLTPTNTKLASMTGSNVAAGGFKFAVADTAGTTVQDTIDPIITYGKTGATSSVHFLNGTATLNVYTKDQVDTEITNAIKNFNAMEYKGTVDPTVTHGQTGGLPTANVHNGDTYVTTAAYSETISGTTYTYPAGSLVIAQGTETDGVIPAANITWKFVDSSGQDTTYTVTNTTHGITIGASTGGTIGGIVLAAGSSNAITLTDGTSSSSRKVTIEHADITRTNTTGTAWANSVNTTNSTVNVITGVTTNAQGHVTGVETTTLTIKDTNGDLVGVTATVSTATSNGTTTATITPKFRFDKSNGSQGTAQGSAFGIASDTLTISASGTVASINLTWGSF